MKKLLDITRIGGYPLCAETLELLHDNVQLLETVLNGLKLPQHTIVRFPYGDYAYVQSCDPSQGNGEILRITTGANLANSAVHTYTITATQQSVTNANNNIFNEVYETRELSLSITASLSYSAKVYNFDEVFVKGFWQRGSLCGYTDRDYNSIASYVGNHNESIRWNDSEIRIRACVDVNSLPIASNSEFIVLFNSSVLNDVNDIFAVNAAFNCNTLNKSVTAHISKYSNDRLQIKVLTHELYSPTNTTFTGQITINAVIAL